MSAKALLASALILILTAGVAGSATAKSKKSTAADTHTYSLSSNPVNSITIDPLGAFWRIVPFEYKRVLSRDTAVAGRFILGGWDNIGIVGFGGSYLFFPLEDEVAALRGFWVGPSLDILFATFNNSAFHSSGTFLRIGGDAGYTWIFTQGKFNFVVSPYLGIKGVIGSLDSGGFNASLSGISNVFQLGCSVGMAF